MNAREAVQEFLDKADVPVLEYRRIRTALVLAYQEIARLRMKLHAEQSGEDVQCDETVRLGGADELRKLMMRIDTGERPL